MKYNDTGALTEVITDPIPPLWVKHIRVSQHGGRLFYRNCVLKVIDTKLYVHAENWNHINRLFEEGYNLKPHLPNLNASATTYQHLALIEKIERK